MGKVSKETGALKLIRAGGIVELYKHPIKASQIMERYPRHCVTRPDFFRNPSIVVKPESVLRLGKVFFIVPYHTIYRLAKSKGHRCNNRHYTPDHNESVNKPTLENINNQMENVDSTSLFHQIVVPVENIRNKKQRNRRVVFNDGDNDSNAVVSGCFSTRRKGGVLGEVSKDTATSSDGCLKPCLKKNRPDKTRFQHGPRVRFMLPDCEDDDEKWDTDFSEF